MLPAALLDQARMVCAATIGHFRFLGFPDGGIRPIGSDDRIAGTAVTLALPGMDSTLLHHIAGMLGPGFILVIDRLGDQRHACIGGGVAVALKKTGVEGVVVDGPCTDPDEVQAAGLPLWSRGTSPITTRLQGLGGAFNLPVSIGGAVVMPGDLIIADVGGIVAIPPVEAEAAVFRAAEMEAAENRMLPRLDEGESLGDISGATAMIKKATSVLTEALALQERR